MLFCLAENRENNKLYDVTKEAMARFKEKLVVILRHGQFPHPSVPVNIL